MNPVLSLILKKIYLAEKAILIKWLIKYNSIFLNILDFKLLLLLKVY